jgi:hypothetical protein
VWSAGFLPLYQPKSSHNEFSNGLGGCVTA